MKLTFQQKVAVLLSLLWTAPLLMMSILMLSEGTLKTLGFSVSMLIIGVAPSLFVLWVSGALPILVAWLREKSDD